MVIDIAEYRRLTGRTRNLQDVLLGPPYLDDTFSDVLDEIETERKRDVRRHVDLGTTW